jgi:uncharacterized protein (DUF305 family)
MQTKPLLYGLIGFFIGGFIVSIAATTFEKSQTDKSNKNAGISMDEMTAGLKNKTGDQYDEAFIANMIIHHEGAVEMAQLSANNAKHDEIKKLSEDIISAQQKEISEMKQWLTDWGYTSDNSAADHPTH